MEQQTFKWRRSDVILAAALSSLAIWNLWAHFVRGVFRLDVEIRPHLRLEVGVGALLLFCAIRFYRYAQQRDSLGFRLLAISLVHAVADSFTMPGNQVAIALATPRQQLAAGQGLLGVTIPRTWGGAGIGIR